jgi:hypothetical protein
MVAKVADLAHLPDWPRLLSPDQAAAYCGMSAEAFKTHIEVQARKFGSRVLYDRVKLDLFLDRLYGIAREKAAGDWTDRFA